MDRLARHAIIEKALAMLGHGDRLCAVGLSGFFDGNTDERSIGINPPEEGHPGLQGFRHVLEGIRSRPGVQDVYIELAEIPDLNDESEQDLWPVGWVVFVVTSAPLQGVATWAKELKPRDVSEGWNVNPGVRTPMSTDQITVGMRPVRLWLG